MTSPIAKPLSSLRHSAAWSLAGNGCARASQWGLLAVIGHLGETSDLGRFGLGLAICNPISMLANLQLGMVLAADAQQSRPFQQYARLRLVASLLATLLVLAACALVGGLGGGSGIVAVVAMVAVYKLAESWSELLHSRLRQFDQMRVLAIAMAVRGLTTLAAFAATYAGTENLLWSLSAATLASAATLGTLELALVRRFTPWPKIDVSSDWRAVVSLARKTLPLGGVALLIAVYFAAPQYFLQWFHASAEVGAYVAAASLPLAAELLVRSASQSTLPRLGDAVARRDRDAFYALHHRVMLLYAGIGLAGLLVTVAVGEPLLGLAFGEAYAAYAPLLVLVMAAMAIGYLGLAGPIFVAVGQYSAFLKTWALALGCMVLASAALVPALGAYGAAWAMLIANSVRVVAVHRAIHACVRPLLAPPAERFSLTAAA